ncbi:MAG: FHA domain-containing protein [Pseudomonadales bacterium]|nr:FHA domain-containing protein [Pseudomonadales bacterium]
MIFLSTRGQRATTGNQERPSSRTEMHNGDLSEYVLDGRDEDGIRYLLRISGDQLNRNDGVVIGRNPKDSPYIINHSDVSRKHARIKLMKDRVFIEDLGSTNGTSVNGQAIEDKGLVTVNHGDQIIIGSVVMKLRVLED